MLGVLEEGGRGKCVCVCVAGDLMVVGPRDTKNGDY